MSLLGTILEWGTKAFKFVNSIVPKAKKFIDTIADMGADAGKSINTGDIRNLPEHPNRREKLPWEAPPLEIPSKNRTNWSAIKLENKVNQLEHALTQTQHRHHEIQHNSYIRAELLEIVMRMQALARYSSNISIHMANLEIHLQTIRNVSGLLNDVNRQRTAVKVVMRTLNHMINVLGVDSKVPRIQGIDIDSKDGAISIMAAYKAFQKTQDLIRKEVLAFGAENEDLRKKAVALRLQCNTAQKFWIDDFVLKRVSYSNEVAKQLFEGLSAVPLLGRDAEHQLRLGNIGSD
ncbi:hypothetical protein [Comamonas sp. MYb396]|uniref:hypothetical protein n=1 Tax=Comamonas sp. MYb396 TaxID=2745302 RepID=UPI00309B8CC7